MFFLKLFVYGFIVFLMGGMLDAFLFEFAILDTFKKIPKIINSHINDNYAWRNNYEYRIDPNWDEIKLTYEAFLKFYIVAPEKYSYHEKGYVIYYSNKKYKIFFNWLDSKKVEKYFNQKTVDKYNEATYQITKEFIELVRKDAVKIAEKAERQVDEARERNQEIITRLSTGETLELYVGKGGEN